MAREREPIPEGSDKARRVNVDFPPWMLRVIDDEATALGVARQAIIKMWLAEKIEALRKAEGLHNV